MSVAVPAASRRSLRSEPVQLQNGDRMSRDEFHAAYEQTPEHFKAELIEGIVYVASPLRRNHGVSHVFLSTLLGNYWGQTPGVEAGDNCSLFLPYDNEPQPDLYLRIKPEYGGQTRTSPDDYVEGAPELLLEVAVSTRSMALHAKKRVYQQSGVKEYLVAVPLAETIFWFDLEHDQEQQSADGIIRSRQFPGLWLNPPAIWQQNHAAAMETLHQGLATPEHAEFVVKLTAQRKD